MKPFHHTRPVRNELGEIICHKSAPVFRVTKDELGGAYGSDKRKRLVVGLEAGDIISFRPAGTRRVVTVEAHKLYNTVLQWQANKSNLERARARKEAKVRQRAARRQESAERRLLRPL